MHQTGESGQGQLGGEGVGDAVVHEGGNGPAALCSEVDQCATNAARCQPIRQARPVGGEDHVHVLVSPAIDQVGRALGVDPGEPCGHQASLSSEKRGGSTGKASNLA